MEATHAARLQAWLGLAPVDAIAPADLARLRAALAASAGPSDAVAVLPHGTAVCYAPGGRRRILELDRRGNALAALAWRADGALASAWVRIGDGSWLGIEPRATADAAWGASDRLWHADRPAPPGAPRGVPVTVFAALDWARVDAIPPLAEPRRLPPGGGTAVLNLIAALAADQRRRRLRYRGPFPTEQLFLALLEAFRYEPGVADPLAAFRAGALAWEPAPHERCFGEDGLYLQLRGRIEKVVWRGRAYYRPDWQGVTRHAPRRITDTAAGACCALWALGTTVEDHLLVAADGEARAVQAPDPTPEAPRPMARAVWAGVVATVAAQSAPELGDSIRAVADQLEPEWGEVAGDLVAVHGERVRLSCRLRRLAAARIAAAPGRAEALGVSLAALAEIAGLVGDEVRARAQARALALPAAAQGELLGAPPALRPGVAAAVAGGAVALARDVGSGRRVDDHPDVEGDERRDGQG